LQSHYSIINEKSLVSLPPSSIRYYCGNNNSKDLKHFLECNIDTKESDKNKKKVFITFEDHHDSKHLKVFDPNTSLKFDGQWYYDFLRRMNSKDDLLSALKTMPENLRLNGRDTNGNLIVHDFLKFKKEWHEREILKLLGTTFESY